MERRNFLRLMVGGIATAAAVRSFPFRVFSFPKDIKPFVYFPVIDVPTPFEYPAMFGGPPDHVSIWRTASGSIYSLHEEISLAEAKARYGYEWSPGYSKTQQSKSDRSIYCAPLNLPTTGLIS